MSQLCEVLVYFSTKGCDVMTIKPNSFNQSSSPQASHLGRTLRSDPQGQKVEISNPGMGIKVQRSCLGDLSPTSRCCSAAWNKLDLAEQPTNHEDDGADDNDGDDFYDHVDAAQNKRDVSE